jgi:hypothetical protein
MPNGTTAPGNVFPAPPPVPWSWPPGLVPTNGFTHFARSSWAAGAATAGIAGTTAVAKPAATKTSPALQRARAIGIAFPLSPSTLSATGYDNLVALPSMPGTFGNRLPERQGADGKSVRFRTTLISHLS